MQGVVKRYALIKNKTVAGKVSMPDFFEILEYSSIKLKDFLESLFHKIRAGFFATNPSGTKSHNRFVFQRRVNVFYELWEGAKVPNIQLHGIDKKNVTPCVRPVLLIND